MSAVAVSWGDFKDILNNVGVPHFRSRQDENSVTLFAILGGSAFVECTILKTGSEWDEYQAGYAAKTNTNGGYDHAGRQIVRTASTYKGWSYLAHTFEYVTSTGTVICKDAFGNDLSGEFTVVRRDINGDITTTPAETVSTLITWNPNYEFDIISGSYLSPSKSENDLYVWVYGGIPELGSSAVKEFARMINGKYTNNIKTDGRSSKHMTETITIPGIGTFDSNRMFFKVEHSAGLSHPIGFLMELYRP
jgi:hypothetical protein